MIVITKIISLLILVILIEKVIEGVVLVLAALWL